jgi:hypothetical protein
MKKLSFITVVLLFGCSAMTHPDMAKSKAVVEALIQKENSGNYAGTSQYYTDDFNKSETPEARTDKFQKLHDALGDFTSAELLKASDSTDPNDFPCVELRYRVKHSKLNSIEEFTVIKEEGNLKVEQHTITQDQ